MTRARNLGSIGGITYLSAVGNSIGIGTTNPATTLHVDGGNNQGIKVNASTGYPAIWLSQSGTNKWSITSNLSNDSAFVIRESGVADRLNILTGGNVGLGTTIPTSKLHIVGNSLITGVVTCTGATVNGTLTCTDATVNGNITCVDLNSTSDSNLKDNIQTIDNALEIVNDIRGVKFEWKENNKPSIGVIAQEVEKVLPQLVTNTETKTVNYNGLIGVLIESVKELKAENDLLKSEIAEIKSHLEIQ